MGLSYGNLRKGNDVPRILTALIGGRFVGVLITKREDAGERWSGEYLPALGGADGNLDKV